jgi:hypothetical protein
LVVPVDGRSAENDEELTAAAQAAVSWAYARRATWTSAPLDASAFAPAVDSPRLGVDAPRATLPSPAARVSQTVGGTLSSSAARIGAALRPLGAPAVRWLPRAAAASLLVAALVVGGRYITTAISTARTQRAVVRSPKATPTPVARPQTGALRVSSTPPGAQVILDGKARGVTPLPLADLRPGRHELMLKSEVGTVRRSVTIVAGETAVVDEPIFSGWVAVYLPFEVTIAESGRVLRADERSQVMLPPGIHQLRLTNAALGYDTVRQVEVKPGETVTVRVTPEPSRLTVTATDAAEVWVDGVRAGETPLNAFPASLGTHELVVRRASGTERRFTVQIGVKPFMLHVDF